MISYEQYLDYSPYFAQIDIEAPSSRAEFLELFNKTPKSVRDLVTSAETAEQIFNLGTIFKLDEYDTEVVAHVIRQIAVGEIPLAEAVKITSKEIKISLDRAREILDSCFRDILTPVVEDIKKIQAVRFSGADISTKEHTATNMPKIPVSSAAVNPSNVVDLRAK
jgi:hypothetical protein